MAPSSNLPTFSTPHASTLRSAHPPQQADQLEPAAGFSLLHTISLTGVDGLASAYSAPTASSYSAVATIAPPVSAEPAVPTPSPAIELPKAPHVVQHCEHDLRRELGTITCRVFDIIAGRRRIDDLRRIEIDPMIHAAVVTLAKNSNLKGVALQSFHASASSDGKKVEFLGSCRVGSRARAFTGTFRRRTAKTRPWVMTAFRVL